MTSAEERVDRLFARFSRHDLPIWAGAVREVEQDTLDDARDIAFQRADEAGRGELLDQSIERVERAYALRLGDEGYWTGLFAVPVPSSAADRAESQLIVEDVLMAHIVEDLVPWDVAKTLRTDGDRLLRLGDDEVGLAEDDGGPPVDPFHGPFVPASIAGGFGLALAWGLFGGGGAWGIMAAAIGVILLLRRLRRAQMA